MCLGQTCVLTINVCAPMPIWIVGGMYGEVGEPVGGWGVRWGWV